ncbi:MAG: sigma-E factor negative regulatory protein [Gammaproteobacteria bacterium]|nr:sigma-E factor negative regulatory protein [Gammaproteobacteria bacterium]
MNDAIRMQISAFVDGELPDNEADLLLRRMGQDRELRQRVAEYLAIGRIMRDEASWAGVDRIHERVSAALEDRPVDVQPDNIVASPDRKLRPLATVAAAAAVAVIALFALQQTTGVDGVPVASGPSTTGAATTADAAYTVPQALDEQILQYYRIHGATASDAGANGMITRFVSLRLDEEALPDVTDRVEDEASESSTEPARP